MNSDDSIHGQIDGRARFSPDVIKIVDEVFGGVGETVLESLAKPVRTYYVRCNTLKISSIELRNRLERLGLTIEQNPVISEALGINIEGPFVVPVANQKIVVDKRTVESALQGANVYAPGILNCGSMCVGDDVMIISELGGYRRWKGHDERKRCFDL